MSDEKATREMTGSRENEIVCERMKLYEEVWAEPVRTVARRYGVSDVGLAKICRKLMVPLPPRGYWARAAAGQSPPKPALTDYADPPRILLQRNQANPESVASEETEAQYREIELLLDRESLPEFKIQIRERLSNPHPLIVAARSTEWPAYPPVGRSRHVYETPGLDIDVSKNCADRAIRIMDALLQGFEQRGWPIVGGLSDTKPTAVVVAGMAVDFRLWERWKMCDKSAESGGNSRNDWRANHRHWEYAGRLAFTVDPNWSSPGRCCCEDLPNRPLESRLNECIRALIQKASWLKHEARKRDLARKEKEERELQLRLAEERRKAKEDQKRKEIELRQELLKEAQNWRTSHSLREYLDVVEARLNRESLPEEVMARVASWLRWGRRVASDLDPMTTLVENILAQTDMPDQRSE